MPPQNIVVQIIQRDPAALRIHCIMFFVNECFQLTSFDTIPNYGSNLAIQFGSVCFYDYSVSDGKLVKNEFKKNEVTWTYPFQYQFPLYHIRWAIARNSHHYRLTSPYTVPSRSRISPRAMSLFD